MRSAAADGAGAGHPVPATTLGILLVAGCLAVPYSSFGLPIPGGHTKPLMALLWLPLFVAVAASIALRLRASFMEFALLGCFAAGVVWLPIVIGMGAAGDQLEYGVRMASYLAAFTVALVVARLPDRRTLARVVRFILIGYGVVFVYMLLIQVPATLGFAGLEALDIAIRSALLNRGNDVDRVTLLADEPSFAAFQLTAAVFVAVIFRPLVSRRLFRFIIVGGVLGMIFAKSITALGLLGIVLGALVTTIRNPTLRWTIILSSGAMILLASTVLLAEISRGFQPISRLRSLETDQSTVVRRLLFESTWTAGAESGYVGLGPGQYSRRWNEFIDQDPNLIARLPELHDLIVIGHGRIKPFGIFGGIFAEFGVFVFGLFCSIFVWLLWRLWQLRPYPTIPALAAVACIVLAFNSAYPIALPDMWLLLGLLVAHIRLSRRNPRSRAPVMRDARAAA